MRIVSSSGIRFAGSPTTSSSVSTDTKVSGRAWIRSEIVNTSRSCGLRRTVHGRRREGELEKSGATRETRMKVLVTGHRGYIGAHLVDLLKREGHRVTGCDLRLFDG